MDLNDTIADVNKKTFYNIYWWLFKILSFFFINFENELYDEFNIYEALIKNQ